MVGASIPNLQGKVLDHDKGDQNKDGSAAAKEQTTGKVGPGPTYQTYSAG